MATKMQTNIEKYNQTPLAEQFVADIRQIIASARTNAIRSVDFCRVQMYWNLGKRILEEEQQGKARADYGTYLIRNLAKEIEPEYGSGFGERQLERARQFYREYPIPSAVRSQLNWSQYRMLIQIPDHDKREYQLYLPTEEQLINEIDEVKSNFNKDDK